MAVGWRAKSSMMVMPETLGADFEAALYGLEGGQGFGDGGGGNSLPCG